MDTGKKASRVDVRTLKQDAADSGSGCDGCLRCFGWRIARDRADRAETAMNRFKGKDLHDCYVHDSIPSSAVWPASPAECRHDDSYAEFTGVQPLSALRTKTMQSNRAA